MTMYTGYTQCPVCGYRYPAQTTTVTTGTSTKDEYVRVVRCKDCKHFKNHTGKFREQRFRKDGICKYHNYEQVMLDGFCSNAERGNDD